MKGEGRADAGGLPRGERRIAESADRFHADETNFVCECADALCTDRLEATLEIPRRVDARPKNALPLFADGSRNAPWIPYHSHRFKALYKRRSAVEREFGNLMHNLGRASIRVRGIERVRLHADLTMFGRLSLALARARAFPLAA